jgi:hypothetical protein
MLTDFILSFLFLFASKWSFYFETVVNLRTDILLSPNFFSHDEMCENRRSS